MSQGTRPSPVFKKATGHQKGELCPRLEINPDAESRGCRADQVHSKEEHQKSCGRIDENIVDNLQKQGADGGEVAEECH